MSRVEVLELAALGESFLLIIGIIWLSIRQQLGLLWVPPESFIWGAVLAIPFLLVGCLIYFWPPLEHPELVRLRRTFVEPLVGGLTIPDMIFIAIASGVAEEVLFRGALFFELRYWFGSTAAILLSGAVFAYAHFIGNVREFKVALGIYFVFGVFLGSLMATLNDLGALMALHATHNFVTMLFVRYSLRGQRI